MNYDVTLPLANVSYPGISQTTDFLSSCLWFFGKGSGNTKFFLYDTSSYFGISSGTLMVSTINGFSSSRLVSANVVNALLPLGMRTEGEN